MRTTVCAKQIPTNCSHTDVLCLHWSQHSRILERVQLASVFPLVLKNLRFQFDESHLASACVVFTVWIQVR